MHIAFCAPITYRAFRAYLGAPDDLPDEIYGLTTDLALAYLELGHRLTVVSWSRAVPVTRVWRRDNLKVIAVPMRNLSTGLPSLVREMTAQIQAAQPDVVHAHWLYEFADAALTSQVPALITAHDAPWRIARLERAPYWWYRAGYAQTRVFPRIETLSTVAPYMLDALRGGCRYSRRLELIPNGIPSCHHADHARSRRIHEDDVTLISISNWSAHKNIPLTLQAFALIKRHYPAARLILVGNGLGPNQDAHDYALKHNLHSGVVFTGPLPRAHIYALMRRESDICVHTSREESFGLAVLESMAQGVPCVAGKASGGIPWLLDDGSAGMLTDIENPASVADGALSLLHNKAAYARISEAGWNRARTTFAFDPIVSRYLEVLTEVARKTEAP
jgi:glycosyltransferase involved in cell wall biosynthesis